MTLSTIMLILLIHYVADFILQTENQAVKKSSDWRVLVGHCLFYGFPFLFAFGWQYAIFNAVAHFLVDYCTSRVAASLWMKGKTRKFFQTVGLDQLLHYLILFTSAFYFGIV